MENCEHCSVVEGTPHDRDCPEGKLLKMAERVVDVVTGVYGDGTRKRQLGLAEALLRQFRDEAVERGIESGKLLAEIDLTLEPGQTLGLDAEGEPAIVEEPPEAERLQELGRDESEEVVYERVPLVDPGPLVEARYSSDPAKRRPPGNLQLPDDTDHVDNPEHYGGRANPYEAIKVMLAWHGPAATRWFCQLSAEKYLSRVGKKNSQGTGIELSTLSDLRKAGWYATAAADILEHGKVRP